MIIALAIALLLLPTQSRAGFFSLFSSTQASTLPVSPTTTTQRMRILEASISPAFSATGGGDVITDESALISNESPLPSDDQFVVGSSQTVPNAGAISIYNVQSGDTISGIAEKFNISTKTIYWANNLTSRSTIRIGDPLVILPITGTQYTVKSGDTVSSIATKFKADANEIISYNGLEKGVIAGEKIIIPGGEIVPTPAPAPKVIAQAPQIQQPKQTTETVPKNTDSSETSKDKSESQGGFARPLAHGVGTFTQDLHGFNGVDFTAPVGTPILASQSGKVIVARPSGYNGGYGEYVVIQHEGNVQTLYAHMSSVLVAAGQEVEQGDTLGIIGNTGRSTGRHVHFEIRGASNVCARNACK